MEKIPKPEIEIKIKNFSDFVEYSQLYNNELCDDVDGFSYMLFQVLEKFASFLITKNVMYGNQALSPSNKLMDMPPYTLIVSRIQDKIGRLESIKDPEKSKDTYQDLMGYITLLCICMGWETFDTEKSDG